MNRRKAGKTIVRCDLPIATDKKNALFEAQKSSERLKKAQKRLKKTSKKFELTNP
jgi:hypothetical protein